MHKRLPVWSLILIVLTLSACDEQFKLVDADGVETKGTLTVHTIPPHDIAASIHGEAFVGEWQSSVVDERESIKHTYGTFSRRYMEYVSGLDGSHVRHGHASLHSSNGRTMECDFEYRGEGNGAGRCSDNSGATYRMIL